MGILSALQKKQQNKDKKENYWDKEYSETNNLSFLFLFDAYFWSLRVWGPHLQVFWVLFFKNSRFACDAGGRVGRSAEFYLHSSANLVNLHEFGVRQPPIYK